VDYYLSGRGMDSLPTLFESLHEDGRNLEPVTIYLALLCLIQIYECPDYRGRPQAEHWLGRCWQEIEILENSGELRLIDDDLKRTRNVFSWYRTQFFREYRTVTGEDDHETD